MKKFLFSLAILCGSMLCACGGRAVTTVESDSTEVVVDSVVCNCDTCQCDTCCCE